MPNRFAFFALGCLLPMVALAQPQVVPLWENGAPGFEDRREEPELAQDYWVRNIHNPSITVFLPPEEIATGAAVLIAPGGGHRELVFHAEGVEAAEFLNSIGMAAFALKYRLGREEGSPYDLTIHPKQDAYRAMRLIRSRAEEWGIDPNRLGIMGFSAGGEVASMVAYGSGEGGPEATDPIDRLNGRPDFQVLIYPGPLGIPDVIPPTAPPVFVVVTGDDPCCSVPSLKIVQGYHTAGLPVEAHIYARGGHAFNMGNRSQMVTLSTWPQRLADWMRDNYILDPSHQPK